MADTATTIQSWRKRLMQAHEHETLPVGGKRALSSQAAAAKMIRKTLKTVFPSTTFSVTSDSFAGGDSIDIGWTDGPTTDMVEAVTSRHEYGHFDGMIDLYEYSNTRDDIPQSKYVHGQRGFSRESLIAAIEYCNKRYGWDLRIHPEHRCVDHESDFHTGNGWASHDVNRFMHKTSLLCDNCTANTLPGDQFCSECGSPLTDGDA